MAYGVSIPTCRKYFPQYDFNLEDPRSGYVYGVRRTADFMFVLRVDSGSSGQDFTANLYAVPADVVKSDSKHWSYTWNNVWKVANASVGGWHVRGSTAKVLEALEEKIDLMRAAAAAL